MIHTRNSTEWYKLPFDWTKYLVGYQVTQHVIGREVDPAILQKAMRAHTTYTRSSLIPLLVGNAPKPIGTILSHILLKNYFRFQEEVVALAEESPGRGMLHHVLSHLPEDQREIRDISSTLIAGLSTLRSYLDFVFYAFAISPEYQEQAIDNPNLIKSIIQETARVFPATPYVVRKITKDFQLGETLIPSNSMVMFGAFAYNSRGNIEQPDTFNPHRNDLDKMATTQGGQANVFSFGPRTCLAKYLGVDILTATVGAFIEKYTISCLNRPHPILGEVALRFDKPAYFRLKNKQTGKEIIAPSSHN